MEYGGRCLKHFDFSAAQAEDLANEDALWLLPALSISRNTYVVMDSEKRKGTADINDTKLAAARKAGGRWITAGREIENYLPPVVAEVVFGKELEEYESASVAHKAQKGTELDKKKAATEATRLLTQHNWHQRDLEEQVRLLVDAITGWNPVHRAPRDLPKPIVDAG